ncbi:MAG TPA: hydantoinase/oxoprolinase family protein, partial [Roseiflexaceae bacterium]|nr:hydantoinase/oxoprolinase family protein [Roseiflexaceae bacterium]
ATSVRPPLALGAAELPPRPAPLAPRAIVQAALTAEDPALAPAALYDRDDLRPGDALRGPAIVAQLDATTVIPPGWRAAVDADLNLLLGA